MVSPLPRISSSDFQVKPQTIINRPAIWLKNSNLITLSFFAIRLGAIRQPRKFLIKSTSTSKKSEIGICSSVVNEATRRSGDRLVGRNVQVLCEGPSKTNPTRLMGRTRTNKIVVFEGNEKLIGKLSMYTCNTPMGSTCYRIPLLKDHSTLKVASTERRVENSPALRRNESAHAYFVASDLPSLFTIRRNHRRGISRLNQFARFGETDSRRRCTKVSPISRGWSIPANDLSCMDFLAARHHPDG